jgi:hypothetical protein
MSRLIPAVALIACTAAVTVAEPRAEPTDAEVGALLARGKKFAEQGKIDLFVAATAAWTLKPDDLRQWEPAVRFGQFLIEKAEMKGSRKPQDSPSSYKDFATYLELWKPGFKRLDKPYVRPDPDKAVPPRAFYYEAIQAPGVVDPKGICDCLILSRSGVEAGRGIQSSVVFANGDVSAQTVMYNVVIICDGDVTVGGTSQAVIVARGNITAKGTRSAVLMAGGKVTPGKVQPDPTGENFNIIVEKEPNTLGVTFFELSTVGLEVKAADKDVQVSAVAAGKPCDKAGLKVGDVILEVNGKKPTDAESLRRLLRDALAVGDATVKLHRGDKAETAKVSLPD